MGRVSKNNQSKTVVFDTQYEVCNVVYRKLLELMISVNQINIYVECKDLSMFFKFTADFQYKILTFYTTKSGSKDNSKDNHHIGGIDFRKALSNTEMECPVLCWIIKQVDFTEERPEKYKSFITEVKKAMQKMLEEQQKYEDILDDIRNIPMFSPEREVLIEKNNGKK